MILSYVTVIPRVLMIPQASCMWSRYIYKQIKYKGTLLWKLHLSCKLHFFQGSALYWSASARTHESSLIKASAQNATQHHSCHSLMGCFIQPSNHMGNSEKCFAEDNWVENYGLMKHMHLPAVKFQPVSALLSNSINLLPTTIHTNLQLWE